MKKRLAKRGNSAPLPLLWSTIEQICSSQGLTEADVARILKLSLDRYRKLKRSELDPSACSVMNLCSAIGCSFEALVRKRKLVSLPQGRGR